jgi:hypothetical protein
MKIPSNRDKFSFTLCCSERNFKHKEHSNFLAYNISKKICIYKYIFKRIVCSYIFFSYFRRCHICVREYLCAKLLQDRRCENGESRELRKNNNSKGKQMSSFNHLTSSAFFPNQIYFSLPDPCYNLSDFNKSALKCFKISVVRCNFSEFLNLCLQIHSKAPF